MGKRDKEVESGEAFKERWGLLEFILFFLSPFFYFLGPEEEWTDGLETIRPKSLFQAFFIIFLLHCSDFFLIYKNKINSNKKLN